MEQVAEKSDAGTPVSNDKTYSKEDAAIWTKQISQEVGSKIMELKMKRYKHVVQVTLGQQLGAGCLVLLSE
uniref:Uncharacterized protein n=1 Tax=Phlebotomus papatasi TaxID=29031 RepID=A0A1B0DBY6_PHLPP